MLCRCSHHARRGDTVCPNRTLLPQEDVERELLDILQQQLLTPDTLEKLLKVVNAKLRAQVAASCPRVADLRKALAHVERQIANYTRAIGKGDFSSLEQALAAAEVRRSALQAELARLDGNQPAVLQLTPAALERHLEGMTEKLRSGVNGKVREVIQHSLARILVGGDGNLTIEAKADGLLGMDGNLHRVECREGPALIETNTLAAGGREWTLVAAR